MSLKKYGPKELLFILNYCLIKKTKNIIKTCLQKIENILDLSYVLFAGGL
ncbi:hypothetical protein HNR35_000059 [Borreliella spielmanii]|uniref:Uncharacterized protein n=1 Tax=Borreliella spielmanii TaxID=88916 RepID=A0ABR6P4V2_9SPIR|nr:hypothetical protein [Borreliella spielmanii]